MGRISINSITKDFGGGALALSNLNLEVDDGEFLVLVGPSGCGKSTALRIMAGLETPTDGEVHIDGEVVNNVAARDRDIAMVFQNYALYPHLSVRRNIGFPLAMRKAPKGERREKEDLAAQTLELIELMERRPGQLSGGQRQRVAMGRAIVREPRAFLMDEPLSNLDAKLRVQMRSEILRLQRQMAITTIYVTHDQVEAMTMGDRVAVLRDGVLQQVAPPDTLYTTPANVFVAGFIGSPPMNLMRGHVVVNGDDSIKVSIGSQHLSWGAEEKAARPEIVGGDVIVGIRPENFQIVADRDGTGPDLVSTAALVESLGAEKLVHFTLDAPPIVVDHDVVEEIGQADTFIARVPAEISVADNDDISLQVNPEKVYLFDPDSGTLIPGGISGASLGNPGESVT